jgi:Fe-S oxidoreductase
MTLADYKGDIEACNRCSVCKFIPMEKVNGYQHTNVCPSIARYNFHAYSGGGRLNIANAMFENSWGEKLKFTDKLLEVVNNCQMCGACDVSCKYSRDIEVLEPINELRIHCVENGQTLPALDTAINSLRKNGSMVPGSPANRGKWSEGLAVKDISKQKAKVAFHAGCRVCFDRGLWKPAQDAISLMQKAGLDIAVLGEKESCCGSRAYQMGYQAEFLKQARQYRSLLESSGVETLVTGCADCYYAFKVLYDKFDLKGKLEVLHTSEFFDRLIKEGKIKPTRAISLRVTYHDPCHLGRLGEPYIHWQGREIPGHMRLFDPPKEFRRGEYGIYEPPRNVLNSIPGIQLFEMDRTREYAWCCGAGGGVKESNPEFAGWTARERIEEAGCTGAEAVVTACPGCEKSFSEAVKESSSLLKVYDLAELLMRSV